MKKKLILFSLLILNIFVFANENSSKKIPTVRIFTDESGIDDKSFNAAAWKGILDYYNDTWNNQKYRGIYYDVVTCPSADMCAPLIEEIVAEGIDLIIVTGFTFAEKISELAELYPEQKFVIIDVNTINKLNVMEFVFHEEEGAYLVGVAAALQSKEEGVVNPKFGFIGGIAGPVITKFEIGYIQGIKSVLPNATVLDYYVNGWNKKSAAKEQARKWYDSGVYAIFSAAGNSGNGVIAQAKELQLKGKKVWAIGVDSDQYAEGIYSGTKSAVLTSMIKSVETATKIALTCVEQKSFKRGAVTLSLKDRAIDFSKSNPDLKPSVIKQTEKAKSDIINQKIKIYSTYSAAKKAGIAPSGLGAKDN
ncbi:MAG: BMP family ABC transporter substrate-binding protein [Treponema sp.]|nr:BMP family ABC transporter substrate-binding protein [Candidatus Treponema merdequi]